MKITANTAVTLRMKVTDSQGLVYDDGKSPSPTCMAITTTCSLLEAALEGQEAGFQTTLELATEDTFGARATKPWSPPCPRLTSRPASR